MNGDHTSFWTWLSITLGGAVIAMIGWFSRDRLKDLVSKVESVRSEMQALRDHLNTRIDALRSDLSDIKARVAVIEDRLNRLNMKE